MKRFVYNDSNSIWHIDVHIKSVLLVVDPRCTSRSLIHPSSESHDVQCGPQRKSVSGSREQGIHPALSHPCTCYQVFRPPPIIFWPGEWTQLPRGWSHSPTSQLCPWTSTAFHPPLSMCSSATITCRLRICFHGLLHCQVFFSDSFGIIPFLPFIGWILRKGIVFCLSLFNKKLSL